MKKIPGLSHGMGIGGWLTNYKRFNVLPRDKRLCLTIGDMEHIPFQTNTLCHKIVNYQIANI